jgi:hypothetical protein
MIGQSSRRPSRVVSGGADANTRIDKAFDWNFLGALDDEYCLIVHAILFAHLPQALVLIDGVF